jgi:hypothetical protein
VKLLLLVLLLVLPPTSVYDAAANEPGAMRKAAAREENGSHPIIRLESPHQGWSLSDVPSELNGPETAGSFAISGLATWYDDGPGRYGAAGPALRAALGGDPAFRGRVVSVCHGRRCTQVVLRDWCLCHDRSGKPTLVDLSPSSFGDLGPLSAGVLEVTVRVATLPNTDTED